MTKTEIKGVVRDFTEGKVDYDIGIGSLFDTMGGCAYWEKKRYIRKAMLIRHLSYQCYFLNGEIDENELANCCEIFQSKVLMV